MRHQPRRGEMSFAEAINPCKKRKRTNNVDGSRSNTYQLFFPRKPVGAAQNGYKTNANLRPLAARLNVNLAANRQGGMCSFRNYRPRLKNKRTKNQ